MTGLLKTTLLLISAATIQVAGYQLVAPEFLGAAVIKNSFGSPGFTADTILVDPVYTYCGNGSRPPRLYPLRLFNARSLARYQQVFPRAQVLSKGSYSVSCANRVLSSATASSLPLHNWFTGKLRINCYAELLDFYQVRAVTAHILGQKHTEASQRYVWLLCTWVQF